MTDVLTCPICDWTYERVESPEANEQRLALKARR